MSPVEQPELWALVIHGCAGGVGSAMLGRDPRPSHCIATEPCTLEWGDPLAYMQKHVYSQASRDPNAPRVPRVSDCSDDARITVTPRTTEYLLAKGILSPSSSIQRIK